MAIKFTHHVSVVVKLGDSFESKYTSNLITQHGYL